MELTDEQRKKLNGEIYEYLLVQKGEDFARAAHSFFLACPDDCAYYKSFQKIKDESPPSWSSRPILENKWMAVHRLQERFAERISEEMGNMSKASSGGKGKDSSTERSENSKTLTLRSREDQEVYKNVTASKYHSTNSRRHYIQLNESLHKGNSSTNESQEGEVEDMRDPGMKRFKEFKIQEERDPVVTNKATESQEEKNHTEKKKVEFKIDKNNKPNKNKGSKAGKKGTAKEAVKNEEEDWDPVAPWDEDDWEEPVSPAVEAIMKQKRMEALEKAYIKENPEPKFLFFF